MGLLLAIFSAGLLSVRDVVSKKLTVSSDSITSAFASFFFALPFYFAFLCVLWALGYETFWYTELFLTFILLRALFDTITEFSKMHAFAHGELFVVSSIFFLSPILMLFFSPILTNDQLTWNIIIGVVISVFGSLMIIFNRTSETTRKGIVSALICMFGFTICSCLDRLCALSASPTFGAFSMNLFAGLFLLPFCLNSASAVSQLRNNVFPFFARGLLEALFMITKLWALQYLQAPQLAVLLRISLALSVINGYYFFKEKHASRKLLGAVISLAGMAIALL